MIISSLAFIVINSLICVLSNAYSYFSILELFNFYDENSYLNFTLMIFNISFVSTIIIIINSLIEEKVQVSKYIQVRSNRKQAVYRHFIRLIKEASLIVLSKIVFDLAFFIIFDRSDFICFFHNSILLYITVLLWVILFDCLSNLKIKNNIIVLFFISAICISYLLLKYSDVFLLLIIRPFENNSIFAKAILLKTAAISLFLFIDTTVKLKKEYY